MYNNNIAVLSAVGKKKVKKACLAPHRLKNPIFFWTYHGSPFYVEATGFVLQVWFVQGTIFIKSNEMCNIVAQLHS